MSKLSKIAHEFRSLRGGLGAAFFAMTLGLIAACSTLPINNNEQITSGPQIMDRVRGLDLLPRFPQQSEPTGQSGGTGAKAQVYNGVIIPAVEAPRPQPGPTGEGYELNFENTPIASVAKVVLGDILMTGYTIDPRVTGMISLSSGRPVPKSDLLFVLENALRLSGVVLVKDVQGYRLIPLGDAVGAGNLDMAEAHADPGYGVSVISLRYVSAATLLKLIDSFATKPGTVRADTSRNMLLIQGSGAERRTAIETVLGFDVDWMRGQSVGVFPIRYTAPEPIITELEKIMDSGEGGLSQNAVKFQPIVRLNAILVVTRKPDLLRSAETWIKRLDAVDTARAGVHVYHVKYGEARQLARVLNEVFVGGGGASFETPASQVAPRSGLGATTSGGGLSPGGGGLGGGAAGGAGTFGGQAGGVGGAGGAGRTGAGGAGGGGSGGAGTFGTLGRQAAGQGQDTSALEGRTPSGGGGQPLLEGVRISFDATGNTVLVYASTENYQIVERTLVQLDRPQLQVAIDATIAEVTLNDNLSYGVQFFLKSQQSGTPGTVSNTPTQPPSVPVSAAGVVGAGVARAFPAFNFLIGNELQPNLVLDALHAVTNTKILQNPSVVVIDNQVATLVVGSDVPIQTGSATVLSANNAVVNTIDYRPTGIILRLVPRISVNGTVRLDIEQEISEVGPPGIAGNPTFTQRKVKSSIAVANGQTVLLAGVIQEQQNLTRGGIPILDQIPKLGDAFSHQNKTNQRTELIIFIRPQIIRDSVDASFVGEELRTKLHGIIGPVAPAVPPAPKVR
jgi:general secretion pathway protein D